jgi:hypothetical protein
VRIPAGLVLMAGGILWFLPIVGLWMFPLGLALIALDIPFLRRPVARLINWGEKKWKARKGGNAAGAARTPR